jgi:hypothetical protein
MLGNYLKAEALSHAVWGGNAVVACWCVLVVVVGTPIGNPQLLRLFLVFFPLQFMRFAMSQEQGRRLYLKDTTTTTTPWPS